MSPNSTPVSSARAFARAQRYAVSALDDQKHEETVRIAFSMDGSILLGNDVPIVTDANHATRLWIGTRPCYLEIEGVVWSHFEDHDSQRWKALHPDFDLKWKLEPDIVLWSCVDRGPHAFLASEWLVERSCGIENEREFVAHLNADHRALIEALIAEFSEFDGAGARVVSINPEGLVLQANGGGLIHIDLDALCPNADCVGTAILRLIKNAASVSGRFDSASRALDLSKHVGGAGRSSTGRVIGREQRQIVTGVPKEISRGLAGRLLNRRLSEFFSR